MENTNKFKPTGKIVRLGEGAFITVFMVGESLTLRESDSKANFHKALAYLRSEDWDSLYHAMRPVKDYVSKVSSDIIVNKDGVFWNGKQMHNVLASRILDFATAGLNHEPLCKFMSNLMANPSSRAVNELYTFLEHKNLPITDNGNFLAYKAVNKKFYSLTSGNATLIQGEAQNGQIYNGVGEVIEVPRHEVDDNLNVGCSHGLHAGTEEYAKNFGESLGELVIVEINPRDVVSIPLDCSCQKLRTCKYKVVSVYENTLDDLVYESGWVAKPTPTTFTRDANGRFASKQSSTAQVPATPKVVSTSNFQGLTRDSKGRFTSPSPSSNGNASATSFPVGHAEAFYPSSSWIYEVTWTPTGDSTVGNLDIIPNHDADCILLKNVPYSVMLNYMYETNNGGSAGKFYHANIKNKYSER